MKTRKKIVERLAARGWISLSQMATTLGVSYPTMLSIRKRGEIKAVRVGRVWRVYEDEVIRYLEEGSKDEPEPTPGT